MISGTYVLTDTIKAAFSTVFTHGLREHRRRRSAARARSAGTTTTATSSRRSRSRCSTRIADAARRRRGATAASTTTRTLVGRNGKVISGGGAPGLAFSVHPQRRPALQPARARRAARWPVGPHQVAIDENTASSKHYTVGDTIGVDRTRARSSSTRSPAIVKIGGVSSLGGATMAIFDFPTAQRLFHKEGKLDAISVAAKPGVTPAAARAARSSRCCRRPRRCAPAQAEAKQATKDTSGFLEHPPGLPARVRRRRALRRHLRDREHALDHDRASARASSRRCGRSAPSRRQVLLVGDARGVRDRRRSPPSIGLFLGLALAKGLNALFVSFGIDLPQAGTVFATRTIVVSLVVGIVVTLLAACAPRSARPACRRSRPFARAPCCRRRGFARFSRPRRS